MAAPGPGVDLDEVVDDGTVFQDGASPSFYSPGQVRLRKAPPQCGGCRQGVHYIADGTELHYEYSHTERGDPPITNADYSIQGTQSMSPKLFVVFNAILPVANSLIMLARVLEFER
jgi:hypothetical protein